MNGATRWLRFNAVGLMGFAVQATTLTVLVRVLGLGARTAVTVAVMAALSHNFLWHEFVTWPDRPRHKRFNRWLWFHVSTGLLSLLTNVGGTSLVMQATGLSIVRANVLVVALMSGTNFWMSDRWIFTAPTNGLQPD